MRGLDYYRHTAFEFVTDRLGSQGTVLAGGRYDGLIESLGVLPRLAWAGRPVWSGWRCCSTSPQSRGSTRLWCRWARRRNCARRASSRELRRAGVATDMAFRGNMKRRMAKANDQGARYALILGDDELAMTRCR